MSSGDTRRSPRLSASDYPQSTPQVFCGFPLEPRGIKRRSSTSPPYTLLRRHPESSVKRRKQRDPRLIREVGRLRCLSRLAGPAVISAHSEESEKSSDTASGSKRLPLRARRVVLSSTKATPPSPAGLGQKSPAPIAAASGSTNWIGPGSASVYQPTLRPTSGPSGPTLDYLASPSMNIARSLSTISSRIIASPSCRPEVSLKFCFEKTGVEPRVSDPSRL